MKNKEVFLIVIIATSIGIVTIIIIASYVLNKIVVDPVKRGIYGCIQLYHDTRSDRLYNECFANMENFK